MSIASIDLGSSPSVFEAPSEHLRLQCRAIARVTCSVNWLEHCAISVQEMEAKRARVIAPGMVVQELDLAAIYPPGSNRCGSEDRTRMKRCLRCGGGMGCSGRWFPPQYVHTSGVHALGICEDCLEASHICMPETDESTHETSTSSPSTMALLAMEEYQVRLSESRLPPEDEQSLRQEIAAAKRLKVVENK